MFVCFEEVEGFEEISVVLLILLDPVENFMCVEELFLDNSERGRRDIVRAVHTREAGCDDHHRTCPIMWIVAPLISVELCICDVF